MTAPAAFRIAIAHFAETFRANFASRQPAQPEDQLKGPVQALLRAARALVLTKTEVTSMNGVDVRTSAWRSIRRCVDMSN